MKLTIKGSQVVGETVEHICYEAADARWQKIGDSVCILYEEKLEGVEQPVHTMVKWNESKQCITMTRQGVVKTSMQFQEGKRFPFVYKSAFGVLSMEVKTHSLSLNRGKKGGQIAISYDIFCDGGLVSKNQLLFDITGEI